MIKRKLTIWLMVKLIWLISISGFFGVTCYGADGHIAMEPIAHNHCDCLESGEIGDETAIGLSGSHDHCTDAVATSSIFRPNPENSKSFPRKVVAPTFVINPTSVHLLSCFSCSTIHSFELSPFYTPLRTVIILA